MTAVELSISMGPPSPRLAEESGCGGCNGACCRAGMALPLKQKEARYMADQGTKMRQATEEELRFVASPGFRRSFYVLLENCANLDVETNDCNDYENRPRVCRVVQVGDYACKGAIARFGPDTEAADSVDGNVDQVPNLLELSVSDAEPLPFGDDPSTVPAA